MSKRITVAELSSFTAWANKAMDDADRDELTDYLAANPKAGDLIANTGGLRKVRWATPGQGKRGGHRVIYYFHDETLPLYLMAGYAKNEKADLSDKERATLRKLVETFKRAARGLPR